MRNGELHMKRSHRRLTALLVACSCLAHFAALSPYASANEETPSGAELTAELRSLDGKVFPAEPDKAKELSQMLARAVRSRMQAANQRENKAWQEVQNRA